MMRIVVPKYVAVEFTGTQESAAGVMTAVAAAQTDTSATWTLKTATATGLTLHYSGEYEQDQEFSLGWIVCGYGGPGMSYPDEAALDAAWFTVSQ